MMRKNEAYKPKKRNAHTRQEKKVLLIKAEGKNKTEKNYFLGLANDQVNVIIAKGNDTDPEKMMIQLLREYDDRELTEEDFAACLVDSDFQPEKDRQIAVADQRGKARKKDNIHLIVSSPCFEMWYICHFAYTTRKFVDNQAVLNYLKQYIPDYAKNDSGHAKQLQDKIDIAIRNAQKLERHLRSIGLKPHTVEFYPSTEVYQIFTRFLSISREILYNKTHTNQKSAKGHKNVEL